MKTFLNIPFLTTLMHTVRRRRSGNGHHGGRGGAVPAGVGRAHRGDGGLVRPHRHEHGRGTGSGIRRISERHVYQALKIRADTWVRPSNFQVTRFIRHFSRQIQPSCPISF